MTTSVYSTQYIEQSRVILGTEEANLRYGVWVALSCEMPVTDRITNRDKTETGQRQDRDRQT